MNRILILDNSIDHNVYQPLEHWQPLLMFPYDSFHVSSGKLPSSLDPYSHIIVTGSEASVLQKDDWMIAEEELVRIAVGMGKVVLGSCFGEQIVAQSLFGKSTVKRMENAEIGWPDIEIVESDRLIGNSGKIINSFVLHFDEVCNLPKPQATVLASSSQCAIQAFKLRQSPVWGIQPHPEIGIVEGLRLIDKQLGSGSSKRQYFLHRAPFMPKDSGWIVPLMREFQKTLPSTSNSGE